MSVLAKTFKVLANKQMQQALELVKDYAHFEKRCNNSLRKLAMFIKKQARYRRQEALSIWFHSGLKPMALKNLNSSLVNNHYS